MYIVEGAWGPMFAFPKPKQGPDGQPLPPPVHRYPSLATPSLHTQPHEVGTEDDVLHIRNLPDFEDELGVPCLGQHDVELLISYLTVSYIKVRPART